MIDIYLLKGNINNIMNNIDKGADRVKALVIEIYNEYIIKTIYIILKIINN